MDRQAMISALAAVYEPGEAALLVTYLYKDLFGNKKSLNEAEELRLEDAFQRLLRQEPLQYITGKAFFRDLQLFVAPGVLIPRPETEELVDFVLSFVKNREIRHILDIGTGSGCIALALKKALPDVNITAIDKSEEAIGIARKNATDLGLEIDLRVFDFLNTDQWSYLPMVDLIVSNPPYIGREEESSLAPNVVAYEPHLALFAETDPLIFYKAIAEFAQAAYTPVICEISEFRGLETKNCFMASGFLQASIHQDLQGKDRILLAN